MAKPRKQTYTLEMYLAKINEKDIRSDQDVQRLSGQWDKSMVNEIVSTVLTGGYIPPVILGEESNSQLWIVDGLQRSTSLSLFRYGNYKITSSIEEPIICYRAKAKDKNGEIKVDGNGDIIWEDMEFNLKNKTYSSLPEELKKKFNEYQIETVIHEGYDMKQISKLVRLYNNHKSMNTAQKAFTYIDNFARKTREILGRQFFIECTGYSNNERKSGTLERVIMETVMCMFHMGNWKKGKQIGEYLNEYSSMEEFEVLNQEIGQLEKIMTDDLYSVFTAKDSFIWFTLFHRFTYAGLENTKFAEFLAAYQKELHAREVNGLLFATADKEKGTKDKKVILNKLMILETLMCEYLHIEKEDLEEVNLLEFVRKNVNPDATQEDIEFFRDMLSDFIKKASRGSRLFDKYNQPSLVAVIAYACKNDIKLDNWIMDFFVGNETYIRNQEENYLFMKYDLEDSIKLKEAV